MIRKISKNDHVLRQIRPYNSTTYGKVDGKPKKMIISELWLCVYKLIKKCIFALCACKTLGKWSLGQQFSRLIRWKIWRNYFFVVVVLLATFNFCFFLTKQSWHSKLRKENNQCVAAKGTALQYAVWTRMILIFVAKLIWFRTYFW